MAEKQEKTGLGFDLPENDTTDVAIPDLTVTPIEKEETAKEESKEETPPEPKRKEKTYENPQARARILEREKRERDDRIRDMEIELTRLRETMMKNSEKAAETEEDPDDGDILSVMAKKMDRIEKQLAESRKEAVTKMSELDNQKILSSYDVNLRAAVEANQEIMVPAIQHIASVVERQTRKENPNLKTKEIEKLAAQKVINMKLQWAREGRDPVEAIIEEAMDYGHVPVIPDEAGTVEPKELTTVETKKEQKPTREAREAATAGLGGVVGASPQKFTVKSLYTPKNELSSETEHLMKIRQLQKAGVLGKSRTSRAGLPTLAERLPGKVRTI